MLSASETASFGADGFVTVDSLIDAGLIDPLKERFERLFRGDFETGTAPDEVNWQEGRSDPGLARQICNGWKADRLIASVVLDARLGEAAAGLAGWPGAWSWTWVRRLRPGRTLKRHRMRVKRFFALRQNLGWVRSSLTSLTSLLPRLCQISLEFRQARRGADVEPRPLV